MTGSDLRAKRMTANIPGAVVSLKASVGRTRLSGIERGTITPSAGEMERIDSALSELIRARFEASKVAMAMGWPTQNI